MRIAPAIELTSKQRAELESLQKARSSAVRVRERAAIILLAADGSVVCLPAVPDTFEGHPGYLHGGIIATLLDEAMSKAVRARGLTAMTRHMEVDYLRPVPSVTGIRIEGRIVRSEGRKHWNEARILNAQGTVLAHAKGLFIEIRNREKKRGDPEAAS